MSSSAKFISSGNAGKDSNSNNRLGYPDSTSHMVLSENSTTHANHHQRLGIDKSRITAGMTEVEELQKESSIKLRWLAVWQVQNISKPPAYAAICRI
jgi:hypothetical protein